MWGSVLAWGAWGWAQPIYYDYGSGGNIYCEGDTIYINEQPYPAEQYSESMEAIATNVPEADPEKVEWMPLGVFALTNDAGTDPTMYLQLAVSKEGIIAGGYENTTTGAFESVEGMVDAKTQRAVWGIVGKERPLMETGVYNLTQDETTAFVHFAGGEVQEWLMVRLPEPEEEAPAN